MCRWNVVDIVCYQDQSNLPIEAVVVFNSVRIVFHAIIAVSLQCYSLQAGNCNEKISHFDFESSDLCSYILIRSLMGDEIKV